MEEDAEVLDWGNEDDELQSHAAYSQRHMGDNRDDAEDAVSLGGDDDDLSDYHFSQSRAQQDMESASLTQSRATPVLEQQQQSQEHTPQNKGNLERQPSGTSQQSSSSVTRSQPLSMAKLTHALPPKPVLTVVDVSPPHTTTLASSMVPKERRSNGQSRGKSASVEAGGHLPPDWEIRYPRGGGSEAYYYNVKTHESTWARPQGSGRISPSKSNGDSRTRSPLRGDDDSIRSLGLARIAPRAELKRRASPPSTDELTYEDRHYRPAAASTAINISDRREERAPRSQVGSLDDRQLARSLTPPPRRDIHSRRDSSRSLSPAGDARRGRGPRSDDRVWERSRNEETRSSSPDAYPSRGRRQRADIEPPLAQEQIIRRDTSRDSREWPAHRHRSSPLQSHEAPLPANVRRMDSWEPSPAPVVTSATKRKNRDERLPSPPPRRDVDSYIPARATGDVYIPNKPDEVREARTGHDVYIPADLIPQRRGRDQDYYENDAKRRRIEDYPLESSPSIRRGAPEQMVPALPSSLPPRPAVAQETELPRRKRQPLPPQSDRFKEASKVPSSSAIPLSPNVVPPRSAAQDVFLSNGPNSIYTDVPSGPRSQLKVTQGDVPPRGPARSYSRFDNLPIPAGPARQDMNATDVDYSSSRQLRRELPRSTSVTYPDRQVNDIQMDSVPKGPRAMAGKMNALAGFGSSASFPPQPSRVALEPSQSPVNMRAGNMSIARPPPPHMNVAPEEWARRGSLPATPGSLYQRLEEQRDFPPASSFKRKLSDAREPVTPYSMDVRGRNERLPRRVPFAPTGPSMKLSGTNNIPIGNRRMVPPATTEQVSSTEERSRLPPETFAPNRFEATARYSEGYVSVSQENSPIDRYRQLPPAPINSYRPSNADRYVPNTQDYSPIPPQPDPQDIPRRRPRDLISGQSTRPSRPTRFGPEPRRVSPLESGPVEPERNDQRTWLTRDEAQDRGRSTSDGPAISRGPSSASSYVATREDEHRRRDPDQGSARVGEPLHSTDGYSRPRWREPSPDYIRPPSPDRSRYPERQSLEGRLSYAPSDPLTRSYSYSRGEMEDDRERPTAYPQEPDRKSRWGTAPSNMYDTQDDRRWDNRAPSDPSGPANPVYPERAGLLGHPLPPRPEVSKPVRIKRPQRSPHKEEGGGRDVQGRPDDVAWVDISQRSSGRSGGSLLERLQLDSVPSGSSSSPTSLRNRVDVTPKGPNEDMVASQSASGINDDEGVEGDADSRARAGRGRKRNGKARRGRRGGVP